MGIIKVAENFVLIIEPLKINNSRSNGAEKKSYILAENGINVANTAR